MMSAPTAQRDADIVARLASGASHAQVAAEFGLSRPRVTQIVGRYQETPAGREARLRARETVVGDELAQLEAVRDRVLRLIRRARRELTVIEQELDDIRIDRINQLA